MSRIRTREPPPLHPRWAGGWAVTAKVAGSCPALRAPDPSLLAPGSVTYTHFLPRQPKSPSEVLTGVWATWRCDLVGGAPGLTGMSSLPWGPQTSVLAGVCDSSSPGASPGPLCPSHMISGDWGPPATPTPSKEAWGPRDQTHDSVWMLCKELLSCCP